MEFLKGWTIKLNQLPTYALFKGQFQIEIDYDLLELMYNDDNIEFTEERKQLLKNLLQKIDRTNNTIKITHNQRYGLGRFYPDNNISPISISRHFKHTLFTYLNFIDLDMVKGHGSIIYEIAKRNNIQLTAFEKYLNNPRDIFNELIDYYSTDDYKLSEENVKDIFNIYIYGGSHDTWLEQMVEEHVQVRTTQPHEFTIQFKNDCIKVSNLVYLNNDELRNKVKNNLADEHDIQRRVMSYWCGTIENHIIYICYKFLEKHNIIQKKRVLLEYDGICFKNPERNDLDYILQCLNQQILEKTKLNVKMTWKGYKPKYVHNDIIERRKSMLSDRERKLIEIQSFEKVSNEFEKQHAKIINKNIFVKQLSNDNIIMSKQQLRTSYEHLIYEKLNDDGTIKTHNFITDWLVNNPQQRCYDDMGIYPKGFSNQPDNVLNLWREFDMELINQYDEMIEERDFILNHIKILSGNDENTYNYLIMWIAQMIQYPAIKSTCPTLISKEGSGKGTFVRLLSQMLGHSKVYETTSPSRDVWGDFNENMANTFLICLNELSKKETIESEGRIKGLITDPKLTINKKGVSKYEIDSFHRFIITTNNEEPISTSRDDRRKFIIRSSDELCGNKDYFEQLYKYLDDVNVIKTCYEYFKSIPDMHNFGKIPIPQTEYHNDLKQESISPIELWLRDFVYENIDKDELNLKSNDIFICFNEWLLQKRIKYECNSVKMIIRLKRLNIPGVITGIHTKNGNICNFNISTLKDHFVYGEIMNIQIDKLENHNQFDKMSSSSSSNFSRLDIL
jgi:hypothetical protein